jgi:hypothetical protein
MYTKCSYKQSWSSNIFLQILNSVIIVKQSFQVHVKRCLHNTITVVYEETDLYFVHTTFDIYVFINITGSIPVVVVY